MKKIIALIKYHLALKGIFPSGLKDGNSKRKALAIFFLIALIAIYLVGFPWMMIDEYVERYGASENVYLAALVMIMFIAFFIAFAKIFSTITTRENADSEIKKMKSMPISPRQNLFSKTVATTIISSLLTILMTIILDIIISVETGFAFSIKFLALGIFSSIFIPFIISIILDVLSNLVMTIFSFLFSKSITEIVMTIAIMGVILLITNNTINVANNPEALDSVVGSVQGSGIISKMLNPFLYIMKGQDVLKNIGIILLVYIAVPAIIIMVFANIIEKMRYNLQTMGRDEKRLFDMIARHSNSNEKAKKESKKVRKLNIKRRSKNAEYFKNEINVFKKNPSLIFNSILPILIVPVCCLFGGFIGLKSGNDATIQKLSNYEIQNVVTGEKDTLNLKDEFLNKEYAGMDDLTKDIEKYKKENLVTEDGKAKYSEEDISDMLEDVYSVHVFSKVLDLGKFFKEGIPDKLLTDEVIFKVGVVIMIISLLISSTEYVSAIIISKHKNEIDDLKKLPMSYNAQYRIMQKVPIIIDIAFYILFIVIASVLLRKTMFRLEVIAPILVGIIAIIAAVKINTYLDIKYPNFKWNTIKDLVSNKGSSIVKQFVKILITLVAFSCIGFVFMPKAEIVMLIIFTAITVIAIITTMILEKKNVEKYFKRIS